MTRALQTTACAPITGVMSGGPDFRHGCYFCGWGRASTTPVMLEPACERCGCALDARATTVVVPAADGLALPPLATFALTRFMILLGLLTLYEAADLGYRAAGVSGSMIAFGVGGFLMLPFVPERTGA